MPIRIEPRKEIDPYGNEILIYDHTNVIYKNHKKVNMENYEKKYKHYAQYMWYAHRGHRCEILDALKNNKDLSDKDQLSLVYVMPVKIFDIINPCKRAIRTAIKVFITFALVRSNDWISGWFFDETEWIDWEQHNDEIEKIRDKCLWHSPDEKRKIYSKYIQLTAIRFLTKFENVSFIKKEVDIIRNNILEDEEDEIASQLLLEEMLD